MNETSIQALGTSARLHPWTVWIDRFMLFCLATYTFILPIGHIITVRETAYYLALALLLIRCYLNKDFKWVPTSFEWPFACFVLVSLASIPTSIDVHYSLRQFLSQVLIPIGAFYIVYYSIRYERDAVLLIGVIIFANLVFSIAAIREFVAHNGSLFQATYRVYGIKEAIEANGLYQAMVTPFILFGFLYLKKKWQKAGMLLVLGINIFVLHVTFTRAAYVALGAELLVVSALFFSKKRWIHGLVIMILLLLAGSVCVKEKLFREAQTMEIPSLGQVMGYNRSEMAGLATTSTGQRLVLWKITADEIAEHPFRPEGLGRFNFHKIILQKHYDTFINYDHTHNTFLSMALELGVQGFIVFMWMIITFMTSVWKGWKRSAEGLPEYLSASLFVMMTGYWVNNFFENHDVDDIKLLFMVMLAVGMAVLSRLSKQSSMEEEKGD